VGMEDLMGVGITAAIMGPPIIRPPLKAQMGSLAPRVIISILPPHAFASNVVPVLVKESVYPATLKFRLARSFVQAVGNQCNCYY
jgi:hypothetical protein